MRSKRSNRRPAGWMMTAALAAMMIAASAQQTKAALLSAADIKVLGRAMGFLVPPPASGGIVAIAYTNEDPASRQDADSIAALLGDGLHVGTAILRPLVVEVAALATSNCAVVIAAAGSNGVQLSGASRSAHALCVTTDFAAVEA